MADRWHPSASIVGSVNNYLAGRCILVGMTGSVAAYRAIDTARWLLRRGARVVFVATRPALEFLGEKLLHWATGDPPVTDLSGRVEHIALAEQCDSMVVAPATLSTLTKIAYGITDNPVSATALSLLGLGKPVIVVPAMHENLMRTRQFSQTSQMLKEEGVIVVPPLIEEEVAKYPDPALIGRVTAAVTAKGRDLVGRNIVVTAGATRSWLDPVRFITNPSSGRMGVELAVEAWARGAKVTLVHGWMHVKPPHMVERIETDTTRDMARAIEETVSSSDVDALIASAAPVDYEPEKFSSKKLRSGESLSLRLKPTPKAVEPAVGKVKVLAIFAAETVKNREELINAAVEKMDKYNADMVVANNVARRDAGFGSDKLDAILIWRKNGNMYIEDMLLIHKEVIASRILDTVEILLRG